ncbi:MAG: TIGR04255 family protein [Oscillospiraceae bacterium]|nr:TIGR04255 family protein [Oscillospiraceae bacterium]
MYADEPRVIYEKNQIINVICQLRFPTILAISAKEPYEFQDAIRQEFPRYELKKEQPAPKIVNQGGTVRAEKQPEVLNHYFRSADGNWTLNLTNQFIALSTPEYSDWETFAHKLDRVLAEFFRVYQPAYFERVGLRYVNAFSKQELELEDFRWNELLQPAYVGLLDEEELRDGDFTRCSQDAEFKARGGCRVKLHAGPGIVRLRGIPDKTPRFILDLDVSMLGQVQLPHLTGALQTVHANAGSIFRGAITDELHNAMQPR